MSVKDREPFLVRVNAEGFWPKAWIVWTNFSSDALAEVLDGLDMAQPRIWITSKPATPDECIVEKVFTVENGHLIPMATQQRQPLPKSMHMTQEQYDANPTQGIDGGEWK